MTIKQEDVKKLENLKSVIQQEDNKIDYDLIKNIVREVVFDVNKENLKQFKSHEEIMKKQLDHQQSRIYKGLRKAIRTDLDGFIEKLSIMLEGMIEGLWEVNKNG